MTKIVSLRATIATDDGVDLRLVKSRLLAVISALDAETTEQGRIHWQSCEVLQGPERVTGRRAKRAQPPQPELIPRGSTIDAEGAT